MMTEKNKPLGISMPRNCVGIGNSAEVLARQLAMQKDDTPIILSCDSMGGSIGRVAETLEILMQCKKPFVIESINRCFDEPIVIDKDEEIRNEHQHKLSCDKARKKRKKKNKTKRKGKR